MRISLVTLCTLAAGVVLQDQALAVPAESLPDSTRDQTSADQPSAPALDEVPTATAIAAPEAAPRSATMAQAAIAPAPLFSTPQTASASPASTREDAKMSAYSSPATGTATAQPSQAGRRGLPAMPQPEVPTRVQFAQAAPTTTSSMPAPATTAESAMTAPLPVPLTAAEPATRNRASAMCTVTATAPANRMAPATCDREAAIAPEQAATPTGESMATFAPTTAQAETGAIPSGKTPAADTKPSPLERSPIRLFNLTTANQLPANALQFTVGAHQTLPSDAPATGNQLYYGEVVWGITDDLQIGLSGQSYDDPVVSPINGTFPEITLLSLAPSIQYRLIDQPDFDLGVQGSLEWLSLSSSLWNTGDERDNLFVGSLQAPMTYTVSPEVQVHLTPSLAFFPDELNGADFYGTVFSLGGGVSWQPSERWLVYGNLQVPLSGGNTLDSDDGSTQRSVVWAVGSRYNVTPRVGLELYGTNGFGTTPATSILSAIPGGSDFLLGARLNYTPDMGLGYADTYRTTPPVALSDRDRQLLVDGFTLATAHTLPPGAVSLSAGWGWNGDYSIGAAYSPDQDFQIEAAFEQYGSRDEVSPLDSAGNSVKYLLGARVRLLDQVQGDPFSLALQVSGGRNMGEDSQVGILSVGVPMTYQFNDQLALFVHPRLSAFAEETRWGLGLGVNYEVMEGLQLIGEVTPTFHSGPWVWAAGTRYTIPESAISVDLFASNSIGRYGLGNLVAEPGTHIGLNFNWILGGR